MELLGYDNITEEEMKTFINTRLGWYHLRPVIDGKFVGIDTSQVKHETMSNPLSYLKKAMTLYFGKEPK